jgi:hypothetical protein
MFLDWVRLVVGTRSEMLVQGLWERFLTTSGKWLEAYLCYSRGRPRYVNLDGKGVDLGGCRSPGSSPGMIAREH